MISDERLNFLHEFDTLFEGKVPRCFLSHCLYILSLNDKAHDFQYTFVACETGLTLFNHYRDVFHLTERDKLIIMVSCLMADIGCHHHYPQHHVVGHGLVYEYLYHYWPEGFSENEVHQIAEAVLQHRQNTPHKPTTVISEIVATATAGTPFISMMVIREVVFTLSGMRGGLPSSTYALEVIYQNIMNRYSETGYIWNGYPELGKAYFKEEWEIFSNTLREPETLKKIIREYYGMFCDAHWSCVKP